MPTQRRSLEDQANHLEWSPPSSDEFVKMKRYKSFVMPLNIPYFLGDFVWLAHENSRPPVTHSPPAKKHRTQRTSVEAESESAVSIVSQPNQTVQEVEDSGEAEQTETDAMWKAGYWIGRIVEIRATDRHNVWMRIRWMCTTVKELRDHDVRTGLPKGRIGGREIFMLGREYDAIQPVGTVEARAKVVLFDESNPLQDYLDERAIFYRSEARTPSKEEEAEIRAKKPAKARVSEGRFQAKHLFPYQAPSCYCGTPYLPLGDRPEPMALCPHPGCLKWFHLGCLDWRSTYRTPVTSQALQTVRDAGQHLELFSGSTNGTISSSEVMRDMTPALTWYERMKGSIPSEDTENVTSIMENHENWTSSEDSDDLKKANPCVPEIIRRAAISPIIRGGPAGIVGNARKILKARAILRAATHTEDQATVQGELEEHIDEKEAIDKNPFNGEATPIDGGKEAQHEENGSSDKTKWSTERLPPTPSSITTPSPNRTLVQLVSEWLSEWNGLLNDEERTICWNCPNCQNLI
nr:hypothetical protein L203_06609 [Cryptococcus depauperatus CBS 7841]